MKSRKVPATCPKGHADGEGQTNEHACRGEVSPEWRSVGTGESGLELGAEEDVASLFWPPW